MRKLNLIMLFIAMALFIGTVTVPQNAQAQQPYQTAATAKYVKTAQDTVVVPGMSTGKKSGIITNQSDTFNLIVYFSNSSGVAVTTSYCVVPPGKSLKFTDMVCTKIFRKAATDSVYSQVIIGKVEIGATKEEQEETQLFTASYSDYYTERIWDTRKYPLKN